MIIGNSCPVKRNIPLPTKAPYEHFLPNATTEDIENDDVVMRMIKEFGRVVVVDGEYCTKNVCKKGKIVRP